MKYITPLNLIVITALEESFPARQESFREVFVILHDASVYIQIIIIPMLPLFS